MEQVRFLEGIYGSGRWKEFTVIIHAVMVIAGLIALILLTAPVSAQFAPYSFTALPLTANGNPGDSVTYTVTLSATPDFKGPVDFSLEFNSGSSHQSFALGAYEGPYPATYTYLLTIPQDAPAGLTADVIIRGKSGIHTQQQTLKLKVNGQKSILDDVLKTLNDLLNDVVKQITRITGGI